MKRAALIDFKGADEAKAEKILVKDACLLRIPAAIGVMVQTLDM